jgi:hypothetical protein
MHQMQTRCSPLHGMDREEDDHPEVCNSKAVFPPTHDGTQLKVSFQVMQTSRQPQTYRLE